MFLHTITGVLTYHSADKVALEFRTMDLSGYYRRLIPKYHNVQGSRYADHVSIVRKERVQRNMGVQAGRRIAVQYDSTVQTDRDARYWWLDCWSDDLCNLRVLWGLPPFRYKAKGVIGDRFHITIGNRKGVLDSGD